MANLKTIIRKHEVLRIPCKIFITIFGMVRALIILWPPLLWKNPRMIRFLFSWFISFRRGASPIKDKSPLIPFEATEWLESFLKKDMTVFEWGSGGSTLFISKRVKKLISVEHDPEWFYRISSLLKKNNISNCELILEEPILGNNNLDLNNPQNYLETDEGTKIKYKNFNFEKYCKVIERYPNNYFDLVFIDGRARPFCVFHAFKKVRPGGFLMLDDSNREQYSHAMSLLESWERKNFFGPKPYIENFYQTTIWQKKIS